MIEVQRFISPSSDRAGWLEARKGGVTATQVSKSATPKGFENEIKSMTAYEEIEDNAYMKFGRDSEQWIALSLKEKFGIMPNEWLIAAEEQRWQMATPDGISLTHETIAEIKTTGTDWGQWAKVPIGYRRQVQWQLHVTGAEACVFAWVLRKENSAGVFVPAWFEPKTVIVEPDPKMIADLLYVADQLHAKQLELNQPNK